MSPSLVAGPAKRAPSCAVVAGSWGWLLVLPALCLRETGLSVPRSPRSRLTNTGGDSPGASHALCQHGAGPPEVPLMTFSTHSQLPETLYLLPISSSSYKTPPPTPPMLCSRDSDAQRPLSRVLTWGKWGSYHSLLLFFLLRKLSPHCTGQAILCGFQVSSPVGRHSCNLRSGPHCVQYPLTPSYVSPVSDCVPHVEPHIRDCCQAM